MDDRPTGSAVEGFLACLGSVVLPKAPEGDTRDADRGTAIHAFLEAVRNGLTRDVALVRVPAPWRDVCALIDVDALPQGQSEVAYAYDVATDRARKLGRGINRAYHRCGLAPTEIPLTLDLERFEVVDGPNGSDVFPDLYDYKSGFRAVTAAEDNPQGLMQSLAVQRVTRASAVRFSVAYVNHNGRLVYDTATHDELRLDAFAFKLRNRWRELEQARAGYAAGGEVQTAPNKHCRYCRAKPHCPQFAHAHGALARAEGAWLDRFVGSLGDHDGRVAAYQLWERSRVVVDMMRDALREDVEDRGEYRLPDGRLVAVEARTDREIDPAIAARVVEERLGKQAAATVAETSVTLARLKRVAGRGHEDLLAAIDAAGGVKRKVSKRFEAK